MCCPHFQCPTYCQMLPNGFVPVHTSMSNAFLWLWPGLSTDKLTCLPVWQCYMLHFPDYQRDGAIFHFLIGNKGFYFYELPVFIFLPHICVYWVREFYLLSFRHSLCNAGTNTLLVIVCSLCLLPIFQLLWVGFKFWEKKLICLVLLGMDFVLFLRTPLTKSKIFSSKSFTLLFLYFIIRYFHCHEMQHDCVADEEIDVIR